MRMTNSYDLIIIGAGINGAGIARDAAMRGLSVLLLDKGDVASGTSSWSTRLIHGGLRYLEHGEIGLVRESLRERATLLKIAPHLVRPLPFLIPIYKKSKRRKTSIRAGMLAYDLLSSDTFRRHRMLSPDEALATVPGLNPDDLKGAAEFYDAQVEFPERLVLENVIAAKSLGTTVSTYSQVTKLSSETGRVTAVEFITRNRREEAQGACVINATGPWIDQLLSNQHVEAERLIGGTKGSHIIVRPFPGAPTIAVYAEAQSDGRPFFIIPWNGNLLIGTTDVRFEGDPDQASIEEWEIDYLIGETSNVFPQSRLGRAQVLYTYSGVRPLPFIKSGSEEGITRRHFVRQHPQLSNLFSIVGGKLTTYRSLAEECVNQIFEKLGRHPPPCSTAEVELPGAKNLAALSADVHHESLLSEITNQRLLRIYGTRAKEVLNLICDDQDLAKNFSVSGNAISAEVVFAFENEFAETLTDCLLRRTMVGLNGDLAIGDDERAALVARHFLGWSEGRAEEEVKGYRANVKKMLLLSQSQNPHQ